ncbi:MAG: hypothetical protein RLZZ165_2043 [Bacteroidota bacterium]|jgi:hypothetical protein
MELRERNYRSRLATRRSTREKREFGEEPEKGPSTGRERFSVTRNARQPRLDPFYIVRKWLPWVILAAIMYGLLSTFVF